MLLLCVYHSSGLDLFVLAQSSSGGICAVVENSTEASSTCPWLSAARARIRMSETVEAVVFVSGQDVGTILGETVPSLLGQGQLGQTLQLA